MIEILNCYFSSISASEKWHRCEMALPRSLASVARIAEKRYLSLRRVSGSDEG